VQKRTRYTSLAAGLAALVSLPLLGLANAHAAGDDPIEPGKPSGPGKPGADPMCAEFKKAEGRLLSVTATGPGKVNVHAFAQICVPAKMAIVAFGESGELKQIDTGKRNPHAPSLWSVNRESAPPVGTRRVCLVMFNDHAEACYAVTVDPVPDGTAGVPVVTGTAGTEGTAIARFPQRVDGGDPPDPECPTCP
jgi:hypothetical protein